MYPLHPVVIVQYASQSACVAVAMADVGVARGTMDATSSSIIVSFSAYEFVLTVNFCESTPVRQRAGKRCGLDSTTVTYSTQPRSTKWISSGNR